MDMGLGLFLQLSQELVIGNEVIINTPFNYYIILTVNLFIL
ncbi:hypothetical protein XIS1_1030011 [Xenorhabdus innexi]|uniref:Uncharacterized protein n=1 Tax=Xenorhabdus innexi TaxID=290109 RepID=A0A1N6MQ88_9GAMM|nr:hypothetical protein Xinn_02913 [Xenorhabdus innexi]SIP70980.1 hypothetical protein XIS1_1030011 [Xenorhabdus innexi]